jgi:hypothetical protein
MKEWKRQYELMQQESTEVEVEKKDSLTVQKLQADPLCSGEPDLG